MTNGESWRTRKNIRDYIYDSGESPGNKAEVNLWPDDLTTEAGMDLRSEPMGSVPWNHFGITVQPHVCPQPVPHLDIPLFASYSHTIHK